MWILQADNYWTQTVETESSAHKHYNIGLGIFINKKMATSKDFGLIINWYLLFFFKFLKDVVGVWCQGSFLPKGIEGCGQCPSIRGRIWKGRGSGRGDPNRNAPELWVHSDIYICFIRIEVYKLTYELSILIHYWRFVLQGEACSSLLNFICARDIVLCYDWSFMFYPIIVSFDTIVCGHTVSYQA